MKIGLKILVCSIVLLALVSCKTWDWIVNQINSGNHNNQTNVVIIVTNNVPPTNGPVIITNEVPVVTNNVPPTNPVVIITNVPPVVSNNVPAITNGHQIASIGPEEVCGSFVGDRPSIAIDTLGQPHAVVDKGTGNKLYIYHKVNGKWTESLFAEGSKTGPYKSSRLFIPHIEIDSSNRAWISCKLGKKEYGTMAGQGLWLMRDVSTVPLLSWFRWITLKEGGNGNVSLDKSMPNECTFMATGGLWNRIGSDNYVIKSGQMLLKGAGEKIKFLIASRPISSLAVKVSWWNKMYHKFYTSQSAMGVYHAAFNGWQETDGSYQNSVRQSQGKKPVTWSSYTTYKEQGVDMCHPTIGIDLIQPEVCYIGSYYKSVGIVANIWNGTKMLYSPSNLLVIAAGGSVGATGERFGPQWTPTHDGGSYIAWIKGGQIKMRYVKSDGTLGSVVGICQGRVPTMATDKDGNIHLMYENGGMKYRKIILK